jgi:hypothetical protein
MALSILKKIEENNTAKYICNTEKDPFLIKEIREKNITFPNLCDIFAN